MAETVPSFAAAAGDTVSSAMSRAVHGASSENDDVNLGQ